MQSMTTNYFNAIDASVRRIKAKAELYNGDALVTTYTQNDAIKSIDIQRVGEDSKFFGIGITHRLNIKLRDVPREINITTANHFKISLGAVLSTGAIEYATFPNAFVTEVNRDENTNELSITAYDILNDAKKLVVNDLELLAPYTIKDVVNAVGAKIGASSVICGTNILNLIKTTKNYNGAIESNLTANSVNITSSSTGTYTFVGFKLEIPTGSYVLSGVANWDDDSYEANPKAIANISVYKKGTYDNRLNNFEMSWNSDTEGQRRFKEFVIEDNDLYDYYVNLYPTTTTGLNGRSVSFSNLMINKGQALLKYEPYLSVFDLEYPEGANFEGTETLFNVLTAASEVTQTVYYVNGDDDLVFKRLDHSGDAVKTIDKSRYITLDSGANRRLQTVCHATELGDNVSASLAEIGTIQYVRDNPFWDLRDDIDTLVNNALAAVGGMTINQFECEWRGDFSLEPGDKIALVTKDNKKANSYLLNDTITYDGGLVEKTEWSYSEQESATSNPTSLGEALKQTFARVDKANKQIELLTTETTTNTNAISSLQLNTSSILASVQNIETSTQEGLNSVHNDVNELTKKVEASITAEDVQIQIQSELSNGVSAVKTTTGFTFDETGLTIAKSESEMKTNIDEDGMSVFRGDDEVLTADNTGVIAYNLKARTYLIIGETSRFEDFTENGEERTGCFWIGETEVE